MSETSALTQNTPLVWVLLTHMVGDNAQLLAIADALGWPYEIKSLEFTGLNRYHFRIFGASLHKVEARGASALVPPWPDIVLATSRECTPVSLWIRKESGDRTRVAYVGQAWADPARFDLFVANPQYIHPPGPNVFQLQFPLLFPDRKKIEGEAVKWRPRLEHLARPWTVALVGGPTGQYSLDGEVARGLMAEALALREQHGGSLIVSTSRRTPPAVVEFLERSLPSDGLFHRWTPENRENPYLALLGLGDRFLVTGDSVSMVMEVAREGKPLVIYPLPVRRRKWLKRLRGRLRDGLLSPAALEGGWWRARLGNRLVDAGWLSYRRDFSLLYDRLIEHGLAVRPGQPLPLEAAAAPDERQQVVARVRALFRA